MKLAILGASGHGKVVADNALESKKWDQIDFFDDAYPNIKSTEHWKILGNTEDLIHSFSKFDGFIVAIGNNKIRLEKQRYLQSHGCNIISIIHPRSVISSFASISPGTSIMAGAIVNAFSTIGDACIINSNAIVEHDCKLADGVHVCPGVALAGNVNIGECSFIGIGSSVIQGTSIGKNIVIGAGSVIVHKLEQPGTYIGVPAVKQVNN